MILSPSVQLEEFISSHGDFIPVTPDEEKQPNKGKFYMVQQSSHKISFQLKSSQLSFRMYYEPGGDSIAFVNDGPDHLVIAPIDDNNNADQGRQRVSSQNFRVPSIITPGPWRICSRVAEKGAKGMPLCDILLLHRRYELSGKKAADRLGTKRSLETTESERSKARKLSEGSHLVLIHALSSPTSSDKTESYSLSKVRDIVRSRARPGVFLGDHSILGCVAVKSIRSEDYNAIVIPKVASEFQKEMRLLEQIEHVRCPPSNMTYASTNVLFSPPS